MKEIVIKSLQSLEIQYTMENTYIDEIQINSDSACRVNTLC